MAERGRAFYDRGEQFAAYRAHRRGGVSSPNAVMEEPAVLAELGRVEGRVLDLGCGDAALGRILLGRGARGYLGVDGSARMIAAARATLRGTAGSAIRGDLEDYAPAPAAFDLVVSRLALHYVADVGPVLAGMRRALRAGGRLVVTVPHPVLTSPVAVAAPDRQRTDWTVDDYFTPGPRRRPWLGGEVTWFHRTVEEYATAVLAAGFVLTAIGECPPVPELFEGDGAELARRRRVPAFLLLAGSAR